MNQILEYNPIKNSDNKGFNGGNNNNKKSGSDNAIKVFAILLIIFAVGFIGVGAYTMFSNSSKNSAAEDTPNKATISFEKSEESNTITVKVTHDKAIEQATYKWDYKDAKETVVKGDNKNYLEFDVACPSGKQTLEVTVQDIDGVESTSSETFETEEGSDLIGPNIDYEIDKDTKQIKVTVTDETEMSYVTYRWNDDEETKIDVDSDDNLANSSENENTSSSDEENVVAENTTTTEDEDEETSSSSDKKVIKFNIDPKEGSNSLTIVAVDAAGNTSNLPAKQFQGVTKPTVNVTVSSDKSYVEIYVYHDNGIKQVVVSLNGTETDLTDQLKDLLAQSNNKEVTFQLPLAQGTNNLKIKAVSVDDTEDNEEATIESTPTNLDAISIDVQPGDESSLNVSVQYSGGLASVSVKINENTYDLNSFEQGTQEQVTFNIPGDLIPSGESTTIITVKGSDGKEDSQTVQLNK